MKPRLCPICQGEGSFLGALGRAHWFRCRNCGMEFYSLSKARKVVKKSA